MYMQNRPEMYCSEFFIQYIDNYHFDNAVHVSGKLSQSTYKYFL